MRPKFGAGVTRWWSSTGVPVGGKPSGKHCPVCGGCAGKCKMKGGVHARCLRHRTLLQPSNATDKVYKRSMNKLHGLLHFIQAQGKNPQWNDLLLAGHSDIDILFKGCQERHTAEEKKWDRGGE